MFHADRPTDRLTHMTRLVVSFLNLVNELKMGKSRSAASCVRLMKEAHCTWIICNVTVPDLPK
jgi:hypothetical protein